MPADRESFPQLAAEVDETRRFVASLRRGDDPWERLRVAHAELMALADTDDDGAGLAVPPMLTLIRGSRDRAF
ncbi:MAG: hypothetical protein H0U05_10005 [Actinobacteria bacterium]|nr:hypothetical protein [Actinomycetota bacterium]